MLTNSVRIHAEELFTNFSKNLYRKIKFYLKFFAAQKQHEMRSCSMTNLFAIFERHASFYVNWNWKNCPHFKIGPSVQSHNFLQNLGMFYPNPLLPIIAKLIPSSLARFTVCQNSKKLYSRKWVSITSEW